MNYPDGSTYCGAWKQNDRHGFGKYVYPNGDRFEGIWTNDSKHGVGNYKFAEADISIRATWIENVLKGPIEIFFQNFRYHGYWNDLHPVGDGAFTFDMKYLLSGHISMIPNPLDPKSTSEAIKVNENGEKSVSIEPRCVPVFIPHEVLPYDICKLPQQPMQLSSVDVLKVRSPMLIVAGPLGEILDCEEVS